MTSGDKIQEATDAVRRFLTYFSKHGHLLGGREHTTPPGVVEAYDVLELVPSGPGRTYLIELLSDVQWATADGVVHPPRRPAPRERGHPKNKLRDFYIARAVKVATDYGLPVTCSPTARRNGGISACAVVARVLKELGVRTPRTATDVAAIARRNAF
jgi:hypothetical protein